MLDRSLAALVRILALLARIVPRSALVALLRAVALVGVLAGWRRSDARRRALAAGLPLSPLAFSTLWADNSADLLAGAPPLAVVGWDEACAARAPRQGLLVVGAHLGHWEAAAQEMARRGLDPLVIAAPWPRLPRLAGVVASLRRAGGVGTAPRGPAAWRRATAHLRQGGAVVVLVDSVHPRRRGRAGVDFVDGQIGDPSPLLRWAQRQGAALWVAGGGSRGRGAEGPARARAGRLPGPGAPAGRRAPATR